MLGRYSAEHRCLSRFQCLIEGFENTSNGRVLAAETIRHEELLVTKKAKIAGDC